MDGSYTMEKGAPEGVAADLPPMTAPESIPVSVQGDFGTEEEATAFANLLAGTVRILSRNIDLERLDGITVSDDYDRALATLDRGFTASRELSRTNNQHGVGVAMAPAVLRNGEVKAHLVFYAPAVRPIAAVQEDEGFWIALHTIAHECGHIEDLKHRDTCFPNRILREAIQHFDDACIEQVVNVTWEEYVANRVSARFGGTVFTEGYATTLQNYLREAASRADLAIREFRIHGDVGRVVSEAGEHICAPVKFFAYLLGNLDGLERDLTSDYPNVQKAIAESPYRDTFTQITNAVRTLWQSRGQWRSLSEFDPLRAVARQVFADGGILFRRLPSGQVYVDVPFRAGTIPRD